MAKDISKVLGEIDSLIRQSQWQNAQVKLVALKRVRFGEEELTQFTSLCCRAGIPGLAVSKLRPIVRPTSRKGAVAKPQHILEFANCLVRLGSCREAESVLKELPSQNFPEAKKMWGHLHLSEWNFHLAIPLFREHIALLPVGAYEATVSKLNLSMALIFEEQYNEAASILNEIISTKEGFQYPVVEGNCYRLLGGLELNRGNNEVAIQCLQKAFATFQEPESIDSFLVRKWIAITQYYIQKGSPMAKVLLETLVQEAVARKQWESVRDVDFHTASFHHDEKTLIKLYYGTSYPRFKVRLRNRFPNLVIPKSYTWALKEGRGVDPFIFDLEDSVLKPGQAPYRLMSTLVSDFYRSFNTLDLLHGTYPGEIYSYGHSEHKLYQLTTRMRQLFEKKNLPFRIDAEGGSFRLTSSSPVHVHVAERTEGLGTQMDHRFGQVKELFQDRPFLVTDVMATFSVGRTTANEILKDGVSRGVWTRIGTGNRIRYQFINLLTDNLEKKVA